MAIGETDENAAVVPEQTDQLHRDIRYYVSLRSRKEALEAELAEVNGRLFEAEARLVERMDETETERVTIRGVGTVYTRGETWVSVAADRRDDQHAWLRSVGAELIIKPTVHHATFAALVREMIDNGRAAEIPEWIEVRAVTRLALRRA